ncbi:MAG: CRISPR-associated protein Csx15 [Anaerolineae bacterium]|nr:CRISPR-associated protein Csx15 [Thermoflexales bacterium]MDW8054372.1 CRISPR-associated protein Csx15 [Anaerolineae bacterium]
MYLLNFSHPITPEQRAQLMRLLNIEALEVRDVSTQFDHQRSFVEQTRALADAVGLSPSEWQTLPIVVNLPALNTIAACLLAELHGRMGYFPPVLRLRPVEGALPPRFEVAEVINLQQVRDAARHTRSVLS